MRERVTTYLCALAFLIASPAAATDPPSEYSSSEFTTPADCAPPAVSHQCDDPAHPEYLGLETCVQLCLDTLATPSAEHFKLFIPARFHPGGAPRAYEIDNPVVIARPTSLHGGSALLTQLEPADPSQPLFVVTGGDFLGVTGLELKAPPYSGTPNTVPCCTDFPDACCFDADNVCPLFEPNQVAVQIDDVATSIRVELSDISVKRMKLNFERQGSYQLQAVHIVSDGHIDSPIVLDHEEAELVAVGGSWVSSSAQRLLPWPDQVEGPFYFLWQRAGTVQLYGVVTAGAYGNADFRIEGAARTGQTHVIAGVRSEGVKRKEVPYPSSLLYVPPTSEAVDVVMKANLAAWLTKCDELVIPGRESAAHFVDYNAAGTLWLLGNNGDFGVGRMVVGSAPQATVVALGNYTHAKSDLTSLSLDAAYEAGNIFNWEVATGCDAASQFCDPGKRFVDPVARLNPQMPAVPSIPVPDPIERPAMRELLPGLIDVTQCSAAPGESKIQSALDALVTGSDCSGQPVTCATNGADTSPTCGRGGIYVPQGTYQVSSPLLWQHEDNPVAGTRGPQIWIAGEGADRTLVEFNGTGDESTFRTQSMNFSTIQGIRFKTAAYSAEPVESPAEANVQLEYLPDLGKGVTTAISIHDSVFDGGKYGLGIALVSPSQCDAIMAVRSTFKNAKYGYASGGQNALGNIVYDPSPATPTFDGNEFAMSTPDSACDNNPPCCTIGASVTCTQGQEPQSAPCEAPSPDECCDGTGDCISATCEDGRCTCGTDADCSGNGTCEGGSCTCPISFGGTWLVLGASIRNTAQQDFPRLPPGPIYFNGLDTDTETLHDRCIIGTAGANIGVAFFDESTFARSPSTQPWIDWRSGGGPIFLNSTTGSFRKAPLIFNNSQSAMYAFNVQSASMWTDVVHPLSAGDIVRTFQQDEEPGSCSSSRDCPGNEPCDDGRCVCDDGADCTVDVWIAGKCKHVPQDLFCDDGSSCTGETPGYPIDICDPGDPAADAAGCVAGTSQGPGCPECPVTFDCGGGECVPDSTCDYQQHGSGVLECIDSGVIPPQTVSCLPGSSADFFRDELLIENCDCDAPQGVACLNQDQALTCGCIDGLTACDDGLFCNGPESCGPDGCESSGPACPSGECVEYSDVCLDSCPAEYCDTPQGCPALLDDEQGCVTDYGAILGCPEGQRLAKSVCDCAGNQGSGFQSWTCVPD